VTPAPSGRTVPAYRRTIWWKTASASPATSPLFDGASVDVAVIGAGFTGLTAAWHLARRGARVAVLEADSIGSGASGLNAGFVVPNFAKADPAAVLAWLGDERGRRLLAMIGEGADRVFGTIREHGIDCDAEQVGWMHVAHSPAMLAMLKLRAEAWQGLGRPIRMLDESAARALSGARHCFGALLDPSGGTLHPLNYAYGLARLASKAGAIIHEQAPIDAVLRDAGGWRLESRGRTLRAGKVFLCTNAAALGVARCLNRAVVPLRVYQVATRPLAKEIARRISPERNPVADTRANLFTYRLDREDRLISGGMAILPFRAEARMARMIAGRLARELSLPALPELDCVWQGTAAMTTDFLPHLYEFGPGFVGGIGCNGRGIALTAMLGEAMADAACGRALSDLPVPLASHRAIPLRVLAEAAPSFAIAEAKWRDWRDRL